MKSLKQRQIKRLIKCGNNSTYPIELLQLYTNYDFVTFNKCALGFYHPASLFR